MNPTRYIIGLVMSCLVWAYQGVGAEDGAITNEMLKSFRASVPMNADTRARLNAISNNNVSELALNRAHLGQINDLFDYRIETGEITNQESSGRCWLFTSLNVLRPHVMKKYNLESFEFSETYNFFWDQLEKANLFLQNIIQTRELDTRHRKVDWLFRHPIGDGGVWNMLADQVETYGVVPKEAMPESHNSENTRTMRRMLARKLREQGLRLRQMHRAGAPVSQLMDAKTKQLEDIYRILVMSLGNPPTSFVWQYKDKEGNISELREFTGPEFYQEVVGIDLNDYVMMMNDPTRDYYRLYEIEFDRNMVNKPNWTFVNLPVKDLKQFAKSSILHDDPMYFSCDVGKQLNRETGILSLENYDYESIYGITFGMNKEERILTFDSGSSHGMSLVGIDTLETGEPVKWLLENSWGGDRGHEGYLIMTDDWFDEYMFRLVVHRRYVSDRVLQALEQEPIKLPPWDPMFMPSEGR